MKEREPMKRNWIEFELVGKDVLKIDPTKRLGKSLGIVKSYCCNRQQPTSKLLNYVTEVLGVSSKHLVLGNMIWVNEPF